MELPNTDIYVSYFSYFTGKDVFENQIFDDRILNENEWDSVLLILDTKGFVQNIFNSLEEYQLYFGKVKYFDYNFSQESLNAFSKSLKYKYQKEIRFSFHLLKDINKNIKRINENIIEITYKKIKSVIIPTNEFREGFFVNDRN